MSEAQFTPGPWNTDELGYIKSETMDIGGVYTLVNPQGEANARLIAAAPFGYALAQYIVACATQEETSTHFSVAFDETAAAMILNMAEAFLAKAEGRQP